MANIIPTAVACLALALLASGCRTDLSVNIGNATGGRIRVKSAYTGREIEIAPTHFKKLPHTSGNLIVSTETDGKYIFSNVAPVEVDRKFWGGRDNIVGADAIVLNLLLKSNMTLYVLTPRQKTINPTIKQPEGYPKRGMKVD